MNAKRNALGKGLGALLGAEANTNESEYQANESKLGVGKIPVDAIEANPYQPRTAFDQSALEELAASIRIHGVIQPLTVRRLNQDAFQLISGERRLRASKLAGLTEVPAYIMETNQQGMLEMALIENIQRKDLNPIEISISYKRLIDECSLKQEELGDRVGKERSTVNNYLRLLKLPPEIQVALRDERIGMGHARAIVSVEQIDKQLAIFKETIEKGLSVRAVEALVRNLNAPKDSNGSSSVKKKEAPLNSSYTAVQNQLESRLETRVSIKADDKGKGEIVIPFVSTEHLNRILDLIDNQ